MGGGGLRWGREILNPKPSPLKRGLWLNFEFYFSLGERVLQKIYDREIFAKEIRIKRRKPLNFFLFLQ